MSDAERLLTNRGAGCLGLFVVNIPVFASRNGKNAANDVF
jgi:hypothetical protein